MRIIAGKHKGRRIELSKDVGPLIRPTSDFARQAIFNILTHGKHGLNGHTFEDKRVLDVFCGTGAFGLEALSRGARHVTFIDSAREAIAMAKHNADRMHEMGHADFILANATRLGSSAQPFDVIFLDPPYFSNLLAPTLQSLLAGNWIAKDGTIVIEHDMKEEIVLPPEFMQVDERRYGRAQVELIKLK